MAGEAIGKQQAMDKIVRGSKLNEFGRFDTLHDEPLSKRQIGLRLPESQFETVKALGVDWIREAIAEKLERDALTKDAN